MNPNAIGLLLGAAFGFILGWARLTEPDVIRRMLLLQEADVFLLMMSAIVTAAVGVRALRALGVRTILDRTPVAWQVVAPRREHLIGSISFGLGWSIAATCPGPLAAQIGRGQLAGLFTIAGLLAGIAVYDRIRLRRAASAREVPVETAAVVGL